MKSRYTLQRNDATSAMEEQLQFFKNRNADGAVRRAQERLSRSYARNIKAMRENGYDAEARETEAQARRFLKREHLSLFGNFRRFHFLCSVLYPRTTRMLDRLNRLRTRLRAESPAAVFRYYLGKIR